VAFDLAIVLATGLVGKALDNMPEVGTHPFVE
jgi:hypothetical protein